MGLWQSKGLEDVDPVGATDLIDGGRPSFLQDYKSFPILCAKLLDNGFTEVDLVKFIGGNVIRVHGETTAWA